MNIKKYLPFEDFVITTNLPAEEVEKRLADNIQPKKATGFSFSNREPNKPYEGQILGNTFTISRIINYRNSFLPIITGHISSFPGSTQIKVKMQPVTFVLVFISIWLGMIGLACLGVIFIGIIKFKEVIQNGFSPMVLIPFGMFLLGCIMIVKAFKTESKKSKAFLEKLFEGHENL